MLNRMLKQAPADRAMPGETARLAQHPPLKIPTDRPKKEQRFAILLSPRRTARKMQPVAAGPSFSIRARSVAYRSIEKVLTGAIARAIKCSLRLNWCP